MALTLWQKLRVGFRVWARRRDEEAKRRNEEFLRRNVQWAKPSPAPAPSAAHPGRRTLDLEGLQVAYLDDSGRIAHYLDVQTGEVVEFLQTESRPDVTANAARYRAVPRRSAQSDAEDRRAFVETLEPSRVQQSLSQASDAHAFRQVLATDRNAERAWYKFKNDRATDAIETWLRGLGLR